MSLSGIYSLILIFPTNKYTKLKNTRYKYLISVINHAKHKPLCKIYPDEMHIFIARYYIKLVINPMHSGKFSEEMFSEFSCFAKYILYKLLKNETRFRSLGPIGFLFNTGPYFEHGFFGV